MLGTDNQNSFSNIPSYSFSRKTKTGRSASLFLSAMKMTKKPDPEKEKSRIKKTSITSKCVFRKLELQFNIWWMAILLEGN